jgi:hypothetical protein
MPLKYICGDRLSSEVNPGTLTLQEAVLQHSRAGPTRSLWKHGPADEKFTQAGAELFA